VRNEEMLQRVKEERNFLQTVKRRGVIWIGDVLRRNCSLKHIIVAKIEKRNEVTGRRRRRRKILLDKLKEKKGYWKLKTQY
jgi:exosome complex RNA-binding protein Rrp4